MICVHIYIYLKTAKIEAFPFVKDPFAVPEKWQFHLATGVCAFRQLFSFMPKKNEVGFGRRDEEASSLSSLRSRQNYVRAQGQMSSQQPLASLCVPAEPGSSVEMVCPGWLQWRG